MDIALVTGASSGLGAEFARALAEQGKADEIWAIARRKERFAKLAVECAPACIRPIPLDLTDRKSFAALRSLLEQERATICIIINNVGCCACGPFEKMPDREIESMIDLDVMGMALLDKTALPFMDNGQGQLCRAGRVCILPCVGCVPGRLQCCQSLRQVPWAGTTHRAEEAGHQCACALAWQYGHRDEYEGRRGREGREPPLSQCQQDCPKFAGSCIERLQLLYARLVLQRVSYRQQDRPPFHHGQGD